MTWAVTFDFHNTLARCDEWFQLEVHDLVPAFLEWRQSTSGHGTSCTVRERGYQLYRRIREHVMATGEERDAERCVIEVLADLEFDVPATEVRAGIEELFRATLNSTCPKPGALEAVKGLHAQGVPLAVVSSAAYHRFLEWTLEGFGISTCFDAIFTSASTGHYKSTPRIYQAAAETLGRDPGRCIHIGDSPQFDVEPAREAGMKTVLIDWYDEFGETTSADLRVLTLDDLAPRLVETFGVDGRAI